MFFKGQHMRRKWGIQGLWPSLILISLLSGCAQPANVTGMTTPKQEVETQPSDPALAKAVCVELVEGGKSTNPLWVSEVDNRSFLKALQDSLKNQNLLADPPEACRFGVEVHLLGLSQPFVGLHVEVTANVNYRVRKAGVDEPYLLKTARSAYTARFTGKKLLWADRLIVANEGAIRKNIRLFINALLARPPMT
jgi:hypothetical protein